MITWFAPSEAVTPSPGGESGGQHDTGGHFTHRGTDRCDVAALVVMTVDGLVSRPVSCGAARATCRLASYSR